MAFIKIISLPGGTGASCSKYTYKSGTALDRGFIRVGEVAEVPDEDLASHLATGKVMQVTGQENAEKRRGRPPAMSKELERIMEIQR